MTVLADDLLLVLLDPASGKPRIEGTKLDYGLGGALLLELALAERIDVVGPKPAKAEVVVLDDAPPDDDAARRRRAPDRGEARGGPTGSSRPWRRACAAACWSVPSSAATSAASG